MDCRSIMVEIKSTSNVLDSFKCKDFTHQKMMLHCVYRCGGGVHISLSNPWIYQGKAEYCPCSYLEEQVP